MEFTFKKRKKGRKKEREREKVNSKQWWRWLSLLDFRCVLYA